MRMSRLFGRTLRDDPADADTPSHRLLVRAGFVDQLAAGLYSMLPLGLRVQRKVEQIVREEMVAAGAQEVLMPVLQPIERWQRSGRDAEYGEELYRLRDRRDRGFVLGPTHEEVVTPLAATFAHSYRDLPFTLFQIQTKLRDEPRPRAGLLRGREFMMKDAYSFDADEAGLDVSYDAMFHAYRRLFARCGLDVIPVEADSGAIGGKESVEFVLPAESGEDVVIRCTRCDYAANVEKATSQAVPAPGSADAPRPVEEVATPGVKTIEALAGYLQVEPSQTLKAVFYRVERGGAAALVLVALRGDVEVNEVKLRRLLGADALRLADDADVAAAGLVAGFASPVGISGVQTVVDRSVPPARNLVAGGNRPDLHLRNVNYGRDFGADQVADVGTARAGDRCPRCAAPLEAVRGIEVGHVFKLGLRYSEVLGARFLDRDGQQRPMWMGCYGIGVGRTVAAVVEASHDSRGMVWPPALAPYALHLVALNLDDAGVQAAATRLYDELSAAGVDTLFDDRAESAGVKFNDADLIGLPLRVTLGPRSVRQGALELKWRASGEVDTVDLAGAVPAIRQRLATRPATGRATRPVTDGE